MFTMSDKWAQTSKDRLTDKHSRYICTISTPTLRHERYMQFKLQVQSFNHCIACVVCYLLALHSTASILDGV